MEQTKSNFEFEDASSGAADEASEVAGNSEGDGDFESDLLPDTNETSAGGQLGPAGDTRDGVQGRKESHEPSLLKRVMDKVATGKIMP